VPWLGIQGDQSPLAPEVVVATALYDWTGTIKEILKLRSEGVMGGQVLQLTLANGGQSMVYADSLAPEALEAANAAAAGIIDGSIEIVAEARQ
jgi:hypothetical protein